MRRLFIIRKDLNLSAGKLAAMVGHCCEAYWTNLLKNSKSIIDNEFEELPCRDPLNPSRPYPYRNNELYEKSKMAFDDGKDEFVIEKAYNPKKSYTVTITIPKDIWNDYVNDIFTKTICEAKNLNKLKGAEDIAKELGLREGIDYGFINDCCKTELTPENSDGTCTVGIWFKPLPDDIAHKISKKFMLYKG